MAAMGSLSPVTADRFFVTKFLKPKRWDLLVFHHEQELLVKRIIGMPGDEISLDEAGHIIIDGHLKTPPAGVSASFPWLAGTGIRPEKINYFLKADEKKKLGAGEYFVIGDHAAASVDSRMFGPVHEGEVVGVVTLIYWPPSRAQVVR